MYKSLFKHIPPSDHKGFVFGPVPTLCSWRVELSSEIKLEKSMAEARRLNQTFELSSTSTTVPHDSGATVLQALCLRRAKQNL